MSGRSLVFVFGFLLSACGGPETNFSDVRPIIAVAPPVVDFGEVGVPLAATASVYVSNTGLKDLLVTARFEGMPAFSIDSTDLVIPSREEASITVTFKPPTYRDYTGRIVLESNDEEHPLTVVSVLGTGADLPFPNITIEPARSVEVTQQVFQGQSTNLFFEIANTGEAPLEIEAITLEGAPEFGGGILPVGSIVYPGDKTPVVIAYTPTDEEGETATVFIRTNDPDEPEVAVLLIGNGGGDFEYPVAIIDCPLSVPLTGPEWVNFDGSASVDPAGFAPLFYDWQVVQRGPGADASVPLDPSFTPDVDLYVDVAGSWAIQLVVRNQLGTPSEPALCVFDAFPEDDIHIELSWDTPAADLDLHLVQGGSAMFDVPEDCNFCNKTPNWGAGGNDDDPRLDIDDRGGYGPENINILHPEDGTYLAKVHYFAAHGDGPTTATVRVWMLGTEVFVGNKVLTNDQVWDVGTLDFPSGLFVPDATPLHDPPARTCQN